MLELKTQNITKRYKEKTAADDITFTLKNGVYGLLGEMARAKPHCCAYSAASLRLTREK